MPQYASFIVRRFMTTLVQAYVDLLESLTLKKSSEDRHHYDFWFAEAWKGCAILCGKLAWGGGLANVPECVLYVCDPT